MLLVDDLDLYPFSPTSVLYKFYINNARQDFEEKENGNSLSGLEIESFPLETNSSANPKLGKVNGRF